MSQFEITEDNGGATGGEPGPGGNRWKRILVIGGGIWAVAVLAAAFLIFREWQPWSPGQPETAQEGEVTEEPIAAEETKETEPEPSTPAEQPQAEQQAEKDESGAKKVIGIMGKGLGKAAETIESAASKFSRYMKNADALRKFHDAVEHDSAAVIGILKREKVGEKPAGTTKSGGGASGGTKFPTPDYKGSYRWPLDAGIVSSEFGHRWGRAHEGIDIAADTGEPVYAAADGVVIYADDGLRGYGNVVILQHAQRTTTLYAHNSKLKTTKGTTVKQGTLIALLGSTGRSTGPHVHFEIREGEKPINPRDRLPKNKYIGK